MEPAWYFLLPLHTCQAKVCYLRMGVSFKSNWRACFLSHLLVSPCSVKEKAKWWFVIKSIKRALVKATCQLPSLPLRGHHRVTTGNLGLP